MIQILPVLIRGVKIMMEMCFTGKNNRFPFLDILRYLNNTHKNPKFGRVRQDPIRELGWQFPNWDLSHFANLGFLWVFFKYPKISKNGNLLFFPVFKLKQSVCEYLSKELQSAELNSAASNQSHHSRKSYYSGHSNMSSLSSKSKLIKAKTRVAALEVKAGFLKEKQALKMAEERLEFKNGVRHLQTADLQTRAWVSQTRTSVSQTSASYR